MAHGSRQDEDKAITLEPEVEQALFALAAAVTALLCTPSCAHGETVAEEPLYEELLFAEIDKDKPKPRPDFPFDDLVIDDEVPEGQKKAGWVIEMKQPAARDWQSHLDAEQKTESVGKASRGRLKNGRRQPAEGRGFLRKNENAAFGTNETVALLAWACARVADMYPGTAPAVMGDISRETGGRLRPHASHQSGRDADVGYYFRNNEDVKRFKDASPDNLDAEKTWTLIDLLLSTGKVEYLFIDRRLHKPLYAEALARGWKEEELRSIFEAPVGSESGRGVIRHQKGHRHHLHVRFACPATDSECR